MTFISFINSTFIENQSDDNKDFVRHNILGSVVLDKYIGLNDFFDTLTTGFFFGFLSCENNKILCTIGNKTQEVPSTLARNLCPSQPANLDELWNELNESSSSGICIPFIPGDGRIYFTYHLFLKTLLSINDLPSTFHAFCEQYPTLYSIVKSMQKTYCFPNESLLLTPMAETCSIISNVLCTHHLPNLEIIHALSNTKYEGNSICGTVYFSKDDHFTLNMRFLRPQAVVSSETRALRKYFQMVGTQMTLIARYSDTNSDMLQHWEIVGIGSCEDALAKLTFSQGNKWKIVFKNEEIGFDGAHYYSKLIQPNFPSDKIFDSLLAVCEYTEAGAIEGIINRLRNQKHGTMLLVSSIAREEASRLGDLKRAIEINDYQLSNLSNEEIIAISSIDGCIISSPNGICTAIGAILDGEASITTDIARGARYNSALTYIKKMKSYQKKAIAVIISEDGSLDTVSTLNID